MPGVARGIGLIADPRRAAHRFIGIEDFHYPGTKVLIERAQEEAGSILHLHNLHGQFFDLRQLPIISMSIPTLITMHDEWLYTGHCAYTLGCEKWRSGCGACPDLSIYPSIRFDMTRHNLQRKASIFSDSRFWLAAPSEWLMNKAQKSVLSGGVIDTRVIHNGVDLKVFKPLNRKSVIRRRLGLPEDAWIILFVGYQTKSHEFKDYPTMAAAVAKLPPIIRNREVTFVCLGEDADPIKVGNASNLFYAGVSKPEQVAEFYNAADLYLHAARADTFPTTILEAMACELPVVATATGGIPEQVEDQKTGFLAPIGDATMLANYILRLLDSRDMLMQFAYESLQRAKRMFDAERMVNEYMELYREMQSEFARVRSDDPSHSFADSQQELS